MGLFERDDRYVRFLAFHPGIWAEVGVLDDAGFLARVRRARAAFGLPEVKAPAQIKRLMPGRRLPSPLAAPLRPLACTISRPSRS